MNYVDYIRHALYTPSTYHRRYDFDLPDMQETVKRVAVAALPFIGLYRPAGFALSVGMNATRTFSHLQSAVVLEDQKKWGRCALEMGKASLGALSLATTLFHFSSALLLTTGCDAAQGAGLTCQSLWKEEYSKAFEEMLQTLASAAYLCFMVTGALEAMVVFALLHAMISLYQARHEISQGRYLEGFSKLAMAGIRLNQANQFVVQIQRRNAFLEMQRIRAVFLKILRGRQAGHLIHHPLSSLKERIESKDVILRDAKEEEHHFGAHFHGNGGALVKGENLAFRTKVIDGKEVIELDFKINHAFRGKLDASIQELRNIKVSEMKEILAMSGSHAEGISVQSGFFFDHEDDFFSPGKAHQIKVNGLGTILIGSSVDEPNLYDRVIIRMESNQTLFGLHEMLSLVDLDHAISLSTNDDLERLKMGHLFRTFFPREATPFERSEEFFSLPLQQLKEKMIEKSPEMRSIFDTYFHRMREEHLFDGRIRYRIDGLAEASYAAGARALTAAVTGAYTDAELFERVASMIRMGMISTEVRHANDFEKHGLGGGGIDYMSGGADSVYTQLLTEKNCRDSMDLNQLYYSSKVRFLISLDALETGTYQYHSDGFGNRIYNKGSSWFWFNESYEKRDSILEFIKNEQNGSFHGGHEVMLKERIDPSFFKGLIVPDNQTKTDLVAYLNQCGLIQNGAILGSSVDGFVRVGTKATEDLLQS